MGIEKAGDFKRLEMRTAVKKLKYAILYLTILPVAFMVHYLSSEIQDGSLRH